VWCRCCAVRMIYVLQHEWHQWARRPPSNNTYINDLHLRMIDRRVICELARSTTTLARNRGHAGESEADEIRHTEHGDEEAVAYQTPAVEFATISACRPRLPWPRPSARSRRVRDCAALGHRCCDLHAQPHACAGEGCHGGATTPVRPSRRCRRPVRRRRLLSASTKRGVEREEVARVWGSQRCCQFCPREIEARPSDPSGRPRSSLP